MEKRTFIFAYFVDILEGHFHDNFITKGGESKGQGQHSWPTPAVIPACPGQEGWAKITALLLSL